MLEARSLAKSYGTLRAVDGVSFAVEPGRILGLLGPNGAGKTTAVSMVSGILAPDSGQVMVDGRPLSGDADAAKGKLGLVPQDLALYDDLSAQENPRFFPLHLIKRNLEAGRAGVDRENPLDGLTGHRFNLPWAA